MSSFQLKLSVARVKFYRSKIFKRKRLSLRETRLFLFVFHRGCCRVLFFSDFLKTSKQFWGLFSQIPLMQTPPAVLNARKKSQCRFLRIVMSLRQAPATFSPGSSKSSVSAHSHSESYGNRPGEQIWFEGEAEQAEETVEGFKKCIAEGDSLPYGPRLYYETGDNVVRMKDIGEKSRILLVGVVGSFTPDCWNRHFFRVLKKLRYYAEREVDYICCVSTNDAFTQKAWGEYLGCADSVLMWADATKRFTKAMGMDITLPWLDNTVRSKRYVIYAEDMVVTKMIMSPLDGPKLKWECEHLEVEEEEDDNSDSGSWI